MVHIITLTGPAHCGKSTIRQMFMECEDKDFRPVMVKKYTTRMERKNDDDVECVSKIPRECDLVYEQYGVRYGLELTKLYDLLERGKTPIVVINDIRVVEELKTIAGDLVCSLFLYRKPASYEDFYKEENERATSEMKKNEIEKTARIRYDKAQAIYRIYIENIQLFDKVVLNVASKEKTRIQVERIVRGFEKERTLLEAGEGIY